MGSGIALDLSAHFTGMGLPRTEDLSIKVGAGVVAADVEEAARAVGLFLPPLPSSAPRCTVGAMVANNAAGARTYKYGAIRDWVRELDVVMDDGSQHRLTRGRPGPDVFETVHRSLRDELGPVPGPLAVRAQELQRICPGSLPCPMGDPVELVAGSEGTLAVVTSTTLDLAPVPEATALALVSVRSIDDIPFVLDTVAGIDASVCERGPGT